MNLSPHHHLKKLYFWTLRWADHPNSVWGLAILSAVEGIFFPIPVDPYLMAMGANKPKKAIHYAMLASFTSVIGGTIGYLLGYAFWDATSQLFYEYVFSPEKFQVVIDKFNDNAFLSIFLAGFTPIPYKVFAIAAGVAHISLSAFWAGSILGRSLRFLFIGIALYFWGEPIRKYIEVNFNKVTYGLGGLLVLFFVLYKFL